MASVSHLGLFPFCVNELDSPSVDPFRTHYPFGISLEKALKWYWRVKTWRVQGSFEFTDFSPPFTFNSLIDIELPASTIFTNVSTNALEEPVTPSVENEKDLVCSKPTQITLRGGLSPFGGTYRQIAMLLFSPAVVAAPNQIIKVADLYYPQVSLTYEDTQILSPFEYYIGARIASWDSFFGVPVGIVEMDGETATLYGNRSMTGSMNIQATEYWPYDPNDGGGPIYDSTTGQQLRAFP